MTPGDVGGTSKRTPDRLYSDILSQIKTAGLKFKMLKAEGLTERAASSNFYCGKPGILAMATSWLLNRGKNANSRS